MGPSAQESSLGILNQAPAIPAPVCLQVPLGQNRPLPLLPILVPLFISAFRRADELAVAMECRCYHGGEGRTKLHILKYERRDYIALLLGVLVVAAVLVLRHFGI